MRCDNLSVPNARAGLGALVASLALSGCLFQPGNGLVIPDIDTPVDFSGRSGVNNSTVEILASDDPVGPFETVTVLPTGATSLFAGSAVIPAELWARLCPGGEFETYVRAALPDGASLITFDDASIAGRTPQQCLADEIADGGIIAALNACTSEASPLARVATESIGAPGEIDGDVIIDDPSDADALVCVRRIVGNLTIDDMVEQVISLPALVEVTGDVTIVYERGSALEVTAETVDLPLLETVGGDVELRAPNPPVGGEWVTVDFGLPRLTSIGGDLRIEVEGFNGFPRGLEMLPTIAGNVTYRGVRADSTAFSLLTALTSIGGNLDVTFGSSTTQAFFRNLTRVDGDVSLSGGNWVDVSMFSSLATVGGGLRLANITVDSFFPALDVLTTVGGVLDVDAVRRPLENVGAAAVSVGGIRLNANTWLTDLSVSLAKYTIATTGPITITDNPNLPECDAIDYVAALPGHIGPVTISGNQPCGPI